MPRAWPDTWPDTWIDAHCHLSDPRLEGRLDAIVRECEAAGIGRFVLGGVDPADWERQEALDRAYPGRFVRVSGLHPWWVHAQAESAAPGAWRAPLDEALARLEAAAHGATAVGETGLDAARGRWKLSREAQLEAFRSQLGLARKLSKPLVLHVVRTHGEALPILEEPEHRGLTGIVHSFSGTCADARRYLALGWSISVSARLTHPEARELEKVVRECPGDRLVFETDSPDQPPAGHEGQLHTPLSLLKVVESASRIRGEPPETLLDRSRDNLVRIFKL